MKASGEVAPTDFDLEEADEEVKQVEPKGFGPMF
jgi:hypothetical protein